MSYPARMLPSPLLSIYRQYKQDTDSVASWLASTAKSCGYPADLLENPTATQAPKSGRLKGKERQKARAAAKQANPKPANHQVAKRIVAIKDFLPLAQWIASRQNPVVTVPDVFSATIDRVISLRSGFGAKLSDSGAEPDAESDDRHGYFVGVLEGVREALRPRMAPPVTTPAVSAVSDTAGDASVGAAEDLGSRFAALSVEEPSREFLDAFRAASYERPKPRSDDPASYEAEPQTSIEDALFSLAVLINDLNRVRSRIEWIWSNHRDGMFDLAAAAVASNTAISLARGLIEDVNPLLEQQEGGSWGVLNKFFFMICLGKGYTAEQIYLDGETDNMNYDLYDLADNCYVNAFRLLISFADVLQPRELPVIKEGMFGVYDASRDRASETGQEKHQEDKILLMEYFTEPMTVVRLIDGYPVEDEFIRGMRVLQRTGQVPFSLAFAAQIFLDIHHTMRAAVRQSFEVMVQETTFMDNNLRTHLDFHKNLKIPNWPASNDHGLRELRRMIEWMAKDPVHAAKAKACTRMGMPVPPEMERHRIFISNPVLCGLYLFRIRTEVYDVELAVANAWGSITYAAHLYNALRQEQLVQDRWPDMEVMLAHFGDANIWVGGERPRTVRDCFQKFCLQMGVSASAFTTNRRRKTAAASRAGPRGIGEGAPVSGMFKGQICTKAEMDWTPELIDDIVGRSTFRITGSAIDGGLVMEQIDEVQELRAKERLRQQKAKARISGKDNENDADGLLPEKLVETLVLSLNSESLEMSFPLLLMHRWCWRLLRAVNGACSSVLRERFTPAYMEKESELPFVVGYILMAGSGVEGAPDSRLLELAAEAVNEMIVTGVSADIAIKMVREMGKDIQFEEEGAD